MESRMSRIITFGIVLSMLLMCVIPVNAQEDSNVGAGFVEVTVGSGLELIDSGPMTTWASYGPGVAWGDYDDDGDLDVFISARFDHLGQETAENLGYTQLSEISSNSTDWNRLFENATGTSHLLRNDGNGNFEDVSALTGVGGNHSTTLGATWVDYDGDGDVDLYLSNYGRANIINPENTGEPNQMFANNGDGTFSDVTEESHLGNPGHSSGSVWVDFDHDGDMDAYSLNFGMVDEYTGKARTETNILYRNDGDSNADGIPEFSDHTGEAGVYGQKESASSDYETYLGPALTIQLTGPLNPSSQVSLPPGVREEPTGSGMSWAAVWFDADGDGWEDLYVASDFGTSPLYHNNGDGTFEVITVEMGMNKQGTGMGAHAADVDGDGDLDICQSNFGPNFLWINNGDGFSDDAENLGIHTNTLVNWDCHFLDYDLDGDMDLWFGVGRINQYISSQYNSLYRNDGVDPGDGLIEFVDVAAEMGIAEANKTMGTALADYDGDGDLDLLMAHSDGGLRLWKNTAVETNSGSWLKVRLHGLGSDAGGSNTYGIGCLVKVHLNDGNTLMQHAYAGDGFLGNGEPAVHFGLGQQEIESITVTWSTGYEQEVQGVSANSAIDINEELPPPLDDQYAPVLLGIMTLVVIILFWRME
ncbi:MAG: CRTAC1 family protein [Candidatus Thalassarchaeaceae archaeon]|nr:CRTAC1 family protein [Candidatus Thalassarchaeaceae archaeon]